MAEHAQEKMNENNHAKQRSEQVSEALTAALRALECEPQSEEFEVLVAEALEKVRYAFQPLIDLRVWADERNHTQQAVAEYIDWYNAEHPFGTPPLRSLYDAVTALLTERAVSE